jgi:hypothetical protein
MSTTYTITLSTHEVPNPQHRLTCSAGRCDELAVRTTFGGSTPYCERHAMGKGDPIPETRAAHFVELDDGSTFQGWSLRIALMQLAEHIERVAA